MNNENFKNYIRYMGNLIKEQAKKAKKDEDNPQAGFEDYNKGVVMAYYTVISTLKNQAFVFDLKQEDIGLADINPEVDLFAIPKKSDTNSK
jgi:glycine betaine/choline ABC-type transport system substrate-binding protein